MIPTQIRSVVQGVYYWLYRYAIRYRARFLPIRWYFPMLRFFLLTSIPIFVSLAAESPTVYVGDRFEHRIYAISADSSGNTYVTGARVFKYSPVAPSFRPMERSEVFVAKLDSTNMRVWIH